MDAAWLTTYPRAAALWQQAADGAAADADLDYTPDGGDLAPETSLVVRVREARNCQRETPRLAEAHLDDDQTLLTGGLRVRQLDTRDGDHRVYRADCLVEGVQYHVDATSPDDAEARLRAHLLTIEEPYAPLPQEAPHD